MISDEVPASAAEPVEVVEVVEVVEPKNRLLAELYNPLLEVLRLIAGVG